MRTPWIWMFVLCGALFVSLGHAATFHVLIVGDENDRCIGWSVKHDVINVHNMVEEIAEATGLRLSETILTQNDFDPKKVERWLKDVQVGPDDVVMYYHSGHGFRTLDMEEAWPALHFGWVSRPLHLKNIVNAVSEKNPRLALVVADVCNSFADCGIVSQSADRGHDSERRKEGYRRLFLASKGRLVATSSKPGQYSFCLHGKGGLFTEAWRAAMDETVKRRRNVSWTSVMSSTMAKAKEFGGEILSEQQEPHYELVGSMTMLSEP